ncbi:MAG: hypothetical protein WC579_01575 [Candidatus Paceibacterota bacterium]
MKNCRFQSPPELTKEFKIPQTGIFKSTIINYCNKCNKEIKSHEVIYKGGLCSSCHENNFIKGKYYSYNDENIHGCYVGIEVEIDDSRLDYGDDPDDWGDIPRIKGWENKRDGSLNFGREIVSPIMPPSLLKKDLIFLANELKKHGNICSGNAGIHIHVNKKHYLSELDIKKLIILFYKLDESNVKKLFGREYNRYVKMIDCHWDDTSPYSLVNTEEPTVEFRGFAAFHTLDWYMYAVDLTLLICEYVRKTSYSQVNFEDFYNEIKNIPKIRKNFYG